MICECGAKMKVVRTVSGKDATFRYYRCLNCNRRKSSEEKVTQKAKEKLNAARNKKYANDKKVLQNDIN
jgi:hypothetical protein